MKNRFEIIKNDIYGNKLVDNYDPDMRYIIFDYVNDDETAKLETVCDLLNEVNEKLEVKDKALELACKYNFFDNRGKIFFNDSNTEIDNWEDLLKFAVSVAEKQLKE